MFLKTLFVIKLLAQINIFKYWVKFSYNTEYGVVKTLIKE